MTTETNNQTHSTTDAGVNRPAIEVRLGAVRAAVWHSRNKEGRLRQTAIFTRSYPDDAGKWHDSPYFNAREMCQLSKVIDLALHRMTEIEEQERDKEPRDS